MQGFFCIVLSACVHLGAADQSIPSNAGESQEKSPIISLANKEVPSEVLSHSAQPWFQGTPEDAFTLAKKEQKPLFLYWGAVWCPPCNELKSSVFNQARFWQEMGQKIPVFLDGDDPEAQSWGEKLNVSGYPTLLFLNSRGEEIFRIATGLSLEEMIVVLKYLNNDVPVIEDIVARLENGKITPTELSLLSYLSWEQKPAFAEMNVRKLRLMEKIYGALPASMAAQRALVASRLLEYWASTVESKVIEEQKWAKQHQEVLPIWFKSMTESDEAIFSSRLTLIYAIESIYPSMIKFLESKQAQDYRERWLAALIKLKTDNHLNIDAQFWCRLGELGFYRAQSEAKGESNKKDSKSVPTIPVALQKNVLEAVNWVDQSAVSDEERIAVISGAGIALYQVGLTERAEELLKKEAKRSKAPYYYYSTLSSLAKKEKNIPNAKLWAHLAKKSAVGRATKIQWMALELNLTLENFDDVTGQDDVSPDLLLEDYYELVFSLDDGFQGRNGAIAQRIAKNLAPHAKREKISQVIAKYKNKCLALTRENGSKNRECRTHFDSLSLGNEISPK